MVSASADPDTITVDVSRDFTIELTNIGSKKEKVTVDENNNDGVLLKQTTDEKRRKQCCLKNEFATSLAKIGHQVIFLLLLF